MMFSVIFQLSADLNKEFSSGLDTRAQPLTGTNPRLYLVRSGTSSANMRSIGRSATISLRPISPSPARCRRLRMAAQPRFSHCKQLVLNFLAASRDDAAIAQHISSSQIAGLFTCTKSENLCDLDWS